MCFLAGVFDPTVVGDKAKWYSNQLEPLHFKVWSEGSTLAHALATTLQSEPSTGNLFPSIFHI